jgi:L-threonylcarbamoyladenylate synthase
MERPEGQRVPVDPTGDLKIPVARAAEVIRAGGVVACPTESFYGLAVNATDEGAIRRLFHIKGRSAHKPVLLLVAGREQVDPYVDHVPPVAERLMDTFWPGGLTLVLRAARTVSPLLTAGKGKIGLRLSGHPLPTALAGAVGFPITGTSANLSGEPACRSAEQVFQVFGKRVDLILDGGEAEGKAGSTVLDATTDPPQILRAGLVTREALEPIVGKGGSKAGGM